MIIGKSTNGKWIHMALAVIIAGACVTHFFGVQGEIHLRADKAQTLTVKPSVLSRQHAVSLFLWDFQVVYAEDGQTPVDYITELRLLDREGNDTQASDPLSPLTVDEGVMRMNKPLKYHGFRFCQSDYDSDMQGVVLNYNYDPWGIGITYTGYALLLLAMIGFFFRKNTYFRATLHRLTDNWSRRGVTVMFSSLGLFIIVMAAVMTHVVTPKPPLQPVLQTPLLGIHVSVIMLAYTLFAVIMVNGITGLCSKRVSPIVLHLSQVLLYPAVFCLAAGIFIGAVWANLSWGRYWGWDPKETWALITMLVYALMLHLPFIRNKFHWKDDTYRTVYHICSIVAFLFVLFTYFGVNRLLGGLHSYA